MFACKGEVIIQEYRLVYYLRRKEKIPLAVSVPTGFFLNYARQKLVVRHYFIIFVAKYATFCVAHCRT